MPQKAISKPLNEYELKCFQLAKKNNVGSYRVLPEKNGKAQIEAIFYWPEPEASQQQLI